MSKYRKLQIDVLELCSAHAQTPAAAPRHCAVCKNQDAVISPQYSPACPYAHRNPPIEDAKQFMCSRLASTRAYSWLCRQKAPRWPGTHGCPHPKPCLGCGLSSRRSVTRASRASEGLGFRPAGKAAAPRQRPKKPRIKEDGEGGGQLRWHPRRTRLRRCKVL